MLKRMLFALLCLALSTGTYGQDVQLEFGKETKVVAETELHSENTMTFLYTEVVLSGGKCQSNYMQLFHEHKWWKAPVYLHVEFKTFIAAEFLTDNIYMAGAAFGLLNQSNAYLTLETLYRYDGKSDWQVTAAYGANYNRFIFAGYADFYGTDRLYMVSENRLFYSIGNHWKIGANLELGLNIREGKHFSAYPFAVMRYDF